MKRILCIRLPSWPIQRLVVAQPELKGRSVILHARDPRRGLCVIACSRAAHRCGIRPGMALVEATSLQQAVAKPYLAEHQPLADAQALEQLAEWCEQFSPVVGFEWLPTVTGREHIAARTHNVHTDALQSDAPQSDVPRREDCLYLDVTNLASYFGSEQQLASSVAVSFARRGYLVRVAIADTLGGAWALSQFAVSQATSVTPPEPCGVLQEQKRDPAVVTASITAQTDAIGPTSSFLVVPPGAIWQALQPLPVAALRLDRQTASLLQQLGIVRIAQLAELPRASLLSRFGDRLLRRWDQACGRIDEVLLAYHKPPQFQTDWTLEHPTTHQATLHWILQQLTTHLATTLRERGEGVLQCTCRLTCQSHDTATAIAQPLTLRIGLFQSTASAEHLQQLIQMQLEPLSLPGPVVQMELAAVTTAPLERRQRDLFADTIRHTTPHLAQLVDRLSSRLGSDRVLRARLAHDAQPERAYHYQPLTGQIHRSRTARASGNKQRSHTSRRAAPATTRSRKPSRTGESQAHSSRYRPPLPRRLIRPIHLRSPPLPLQVVAVAPDGPPIQLWLQQRAYRVARCWGPERLETGWWRGRSIRRDYYRVETESGHWLWLFRQLHEGHWFLHGLFG